MKQPNFNTVKGRLYVFLQNMVGEVISGETIMTIDPHHRLSGLRRIRELKQEGLVDYDVVDYAKSKYLIKEVK